MRYIGLTINFRCFLKKGSNGIDKIRRKVTLEQREIDSARGLSKEIRKTGTGPK